MRMALFFVAGILSGVYAPEAVFLVVRWFQEGVSPFVMG
jgi:hypothetical protein